MALNFSMLSYYSIVIIPDPVALRLPNQRGAIELAPLWV